MGKFALIWWIDFKETEIIPKSFLPKSKQITNSVLDLKYKAAGKTLEGKARVLAIKDTKEILEKLNVDSDGQIRTFETKLFPKKSIADQKSAASAAKTRRQNKKNTIKKVEREIAEESQIFELNQSLASELNPAEIAEENSEKKACDVHVNNESQLHEEDGVKENGQSVTDAPARDAECSSELSDHEILVNSDEVMLSKQSNAANNLILAAILPGGVTLRDIAYQENLLAAMKRSYEWHNKSNRNSQATFQISSQFKNPGAKDQEKAEIAAESGIFFPVSVKSYIEKKSEIIPGVCDWKILVREAVLEVYGSSIQNYSAKGSRDGSRPGIDSQFYNALFKWAISKTVGGNSLTEKEYINFVNKMCHNKRRYKNKQDERDQEDPVKRTKVSNLTPSTASQYAPTSTTPQRPRIIESTLSQPPKSVDHASNYMPNLASSSQQPIITQQILNYPTPSINSQQPNGHVSSYVPNFVTIPHTAISKNNNNYSYIPPYSPPGSNNVHQWPNQTFRPSYSSTAAEGDSNIMYENTSGSNWNPFTVG